MTPTSCKACGYQLVRHFPRVLDPQTNERFRIDKCVNCGLGHTIPQPVDLTKYYGTTYYGGRHSFSASYRARQRLRIVESIIGNEVNRSILDIGCGDGTFLLEAKKKGWKVIGTEIYPHIARKAGLDVRETIEQVYDCPPFDCITFWHSLEHLRNPRSAMILAAKLLKPNGAFIISVPDSAGLQAKVFGSGWFHRDVPRHLYHFDARSLTSLTHSVGCTPERWWYQELEYDILGWSQSILNLLLPSSNLFFYTLTGRPSKVNKLLELWSFVLGSLLSILLLPAVAISTLSRHGGTLIVAARPDK